MIPLIIEKRDAFLIVRPENIELSDAERRKLLAFANEELEDEIIELMDEAEKIAAPKVLFAVAPVEESDVNGILVNGSHIDSAFVSEKLAGKRRCFPYIATCGAELEAWSEQFKDDILLEFWADEVKKLYLSRVLAPFMGYIKEAYQTGGHLAALNPGSLKEWPISGQADLFGVLGGSAFVQEQAGVRYTESFLMLPSKTTSGILFESETFYENCQHCPIENCPNRRAKQLDVVEK